MTSRQVRRLSRATVSSHHDASRLELLENYLVHHEDLASCAQISLEWLGRCAGVKRSLCLAVDSDAGVLRGIAGDGVPSGEVDLFAWPLSDTRDPIVAALAASDPVVCRPGRVAGRVGRVTLATPLGAGPFTAIPLRGARETDQSALGLLLLRSETGFSADISWLVAVLGQKIEQIRGRRGLAEEVRKLRREALERARLHEQLKLASDELQVRVQAATAELATQNELLRRQAVELEQASRLKSQFLANMSHEFRTPLNAILGYTHMLLQGVAGDMLPAVKRQLQRIDSNGRHLLTIINEILDITRIEAGKMPMQLSEFNLNELVPEVMAELDAIIARSKLDVTPQLSTDVPLVYSDRQKVKQIVVNLLSNALKFTHQGSIEIAVQFGPGTKAASIAVSDTGIGIAPEHHERIFEDFRQVDDSPSRQYGGTGLGLAICRRLATALGGRITFHSNVGQGSTFTLTIPVEAPQ